MPKVKVDKEARMETPSDRAKKAADKLGGYSGNAAQAIIDRKKKMEAEMKKLGY